jgi:xanthine dehydrogenase accessory factor
MHGGARFVRDPRRFVRQPRLARMPPVGSPTADACIARSWVMDRRETERLVAAIRDAQRRGEGAAIATVIRVHGSAYRREGTRMLVRDDGSYECALSGGCLEPEVIERARTVIATGQSVVVKYDLEDDWLFGLGIGCTGAVDIRIERIADDPILDDWLNVLERAEPGVLASIVGGDAPTRLLVRPNGSTTGTLGNPALDTAATRQAMRRLGDALPSAGLADADGTEIFLDVSVPPARLVIFGAGYDAAPLARLAWSMGLDVTVVDVRPAFLTDTRFPDATRVLAPFGDFIEQVPLTTRTFVVVMNHHLERDRESLRYALTAGVAYIGVLGPRARYERLLAQLDADGFRPRPDALARVRSPVGLSLGAETPEEVALSILGEMLAIQRGFPGGFLNGRTTSLHRRSPSTSSTESEARR